MKEWLEYLRNMRPAARWSLGIGLGLVVALTVGLVFWATRPVYGPLYQDLSTQDLAQIASTLDKWHVPYRYGQDGSSIEVPNGDVADARMRLATEGVPSHGTVGLEIFDNADYGMTEFAQKVNYQRAIQGELERTIMALKEVKFARVHITMKQSDLFLKDEESPKASVTIAMREGDKLLPAQINGIQHLVGAAVEGLDPSSVIVVDDKGDALSGSGGDPNGTADMDARLQEQAKIEGVLKQKISGLLADSLGLKGASVSVSVLLNFDHVKHTEQQVLTRPDGDGFVVHKQETSNDPTTGDGAPEDKPGPKKVVTSSLVDYENGKSYEEVDYAQGRVQRITVGVIVPESLAPDQQQRLRDVIAAAAGLDQTRGDQLQLAAILPPKPASLPVTQLAAPQTVGVKDAPAVEGYETLIPVFKWGALILLLTLGLSLTTLTFMRKKERLSPEKREAVLLEIRRWLSDAGQ